MRTCYFTYLDKLYLLILLFVAGITANGQNLLPESDFYSPVNGMWFIVDYNELTPPYSGTTSQGDFAFVTDPQLINENFLSGGDHTSGTGNMLVIDGPAIDNQPFWRAGPDGSGHCGLIPGQTYFFSYWIKSVSPDSNNLDARADIYTEITNVTSFQLVNGNTLAPVTSMDWQKVTYSFVAVSECITIALSNNNTNSFGNDFAIDDLELALPFSFTYSVTTDRCINESAANIYIYTRGGEGPYTFSISGAVNQTGTTSAFFNLPNGDYVISVTKQDGTTVSTQPFSIAVPGAQLIASDHVNLCQGESTTLSATGGPGTYTWHSTPADPATVNVTGPITVSPTQTTTYYALSTLTWDNNLVTNGDFSQGNHGFFSKYAYKAENPNDYPQTYGVVSNPQTWNASYSACGDHTTGNGNMLVVNGNTNIAGASPIWGQTVTIRPQTEYVLSFWVHSLTPLNPARFRVSMSGSSFINTPLAPAISECGNWTQFTFTWSTLYVLAEAVTIEISDIEYSLEGNDFAIDDIEFYRVGPCTIGDDIIVTVGNTVPVFTQVASICPGETLSPLPVVSNNNIAGTWSPAINNLETTTYTFTPASGECASSVNMTIEVTETLPLFAPVSPICKNEQVLPLPTVSTNGITGSWSPFLNNTATTTYTFTPTPGQCASPVTMTIEVVENIVPVFTQHPAICSQQTPLSLPLISENNITGSWSPSLNNTETTTYTFTPHPEQCAVPVTMTIVVNQATIPSFTETAPVCAGESLLTLPSISNNGITGTWSPDFNNLQTTTYTFTPDEGQCAVPTTLTISITGSSLPFAESPQIFCYNQHVTINNLSATGENLRWYLMPSGGNNLGYNYLITHNTTLYVSQTISGCESSRLPVTINFTEPPVISNLVIADFNENNNSITVIVQEPGTFQYSINNQTFQNENYFNGLESGLYTISVKNECGITTTEAVVNMYPKYFTPNGDGVNDTWYIYNKNGLYDYEVYVYDRFGKLITILNKNNRSWDGKYDGKDLPSTDYWFLLIVNKIPKIIKSHFSLIR